MSILRRLDPIVLVGTAFVLALVVALPVALALVSVDTMSDEIGVGCSTGELSAAALHSSCSD